MGLRVVHVVRWWVRRPVQSNQRIVFNALVHDLANIPGVVGVLTGMPMALSLPELDQSWDLGFIVMLASHSAVDVYMTHPAHDAVLTLVGWWGVERVDMFYVDIQPAFTARDELLEGQAT